MEQRDVSNIRPGSMRTLPRHTGPDQVSRCDTTLLKFECDELGL